MSDWNDIAHKAERSYSQWDKVLSQPKKLNGDTFKCPWCGKLHSIANAKTIKVVGSKDLINTSHSYNMTTKTYAKTTFRVRLCGRCFNKNQRNKKIFFNAGKVLYLLLGIFLLYYMCTTDEKLGFDGIFGIIFMYSIIALCALGGKEWVEENLFDVANIKDAHRDNALG